jgi:phage baseplate assembly protein W
MAIKIKNLEQFKDVYSDKPYFYKDLALDISTANIVTPTKEFPQPGIDIQASYDIQAISNSLLNLFNTTPGERMLFPNYGLNLKPYLFSPITAGNGKAIGQTILDKIKAFEPRISVIFVDVIADIDKQQYEITISIEIPILRQQAQLGFALDIRRQTFISIPVQ